MRHKIDKDRLIRNFSRYAHLYDKYASIQRLAAKELIKEITQKNVTNILEIGCGTGNYTKLLKERFKEATIQALDISKKMVETAQKKLVGKGVEFIVADAEAMVIGPSFSLITSNAAFQWFDNLGRVCKKYKEALRENGVLAFSSFGPLTFWELNRCLNIAIGKNVSLSSAYFLDKGMLEEILKRDFKKVIIRELITKEKYHSLKELLWKIKYTGTRGSGLGSQFLGQRRLLERMEEIYQAEFGQIKATYQIFFSKAIN
jgi:malonyl-CoA O-methyltransferase